MVNCQKPTGAWPALSVITGILVLAAMISTSAFWEKEREAPLLNRNDGFFRPESADELLERAQKLLQLLDERTGADAIEPQLLRPDCDDAAAQRIFKLDAERTFKSEEFRQQLVEVSRSVSATSYVQTLEGKFSGRRCWPA